MRALPAVLGLALAALVGCAPQPVDPPKPLPPASSPGPAVISIPTLAVAEKLERTGLNPDRTVQVPPVETPEIPAWVEVGPKPGDVGRALIVGHVNGGGRPGVFAELATLQPGAEVIVTRDDGSDLRFVIDSVTQHPKSDFPEGRVYGDTQRPEIALVTCGGTLDEAAHSYLDNIVAVGHLA